MVQTFKQSFRILITKMVDYEFISGFLFIYLRFGFCYLKSLQLWILHLNTLLSLHSKNSTIY